jgi:hypothetical protein
MRLAGVKPLAKEWPIFVKVRLKRPFDWRHTNPRLFDEAIIAAPNYRRRVLGRLSRWTTAIFGTVASATHSQIKQFDDKKALARTREPRAKSTWGISSAGREMATQSNGAYGSTADEKGRRSHEPMRCDHCRKSFGLILHRYFRMRFCSADCLSAYQRRLDDLTMIKIRSLELPRALPT